MNESLWAEAQRLQRVALLLERDAAKLKEQAAQLMQRIAGAEAALTVMRAASSFKPVGRSMHSQGVVNQQHGSQKT